MPEILLEEEQKDGFKVINDQTAEWALLKVKEYIAERDRLISVCEEQIKYYKDMIESETQKCESSTGYLKMLLVEYFHTVPHKETKTQESYKLPSGSLVLKKAKVDFEHDDETLLSYLKQNDPGMVVVTEKPAWGEFKKKLVIDGNTVIDSETGLVVEGVTVIEKPESFDIK